MRRSGCCLASRRSRRLIASSVRRRRWAGSSVCHTASSTGTSSSGKNRRQRRFEGFVQGKEFARYLLANFSVVVAILNFEVVLEEIDDRQITCRLAIGDRGALKDQPIFKSMRVGKFVDEA